MDSNDPDLEAFKSNLFRIFGERELGKAAALVSNLCPNASDPQLISISSKDKADANLPASHHLSWIQRIYQKITKHPQNQGISTLKQIPDTPQGVGWLFSGKI